MTTIEHFTAFSKYLCLEDTMTHGIGGADPCSWDDACDRFAAAVEEDRGARVYRLDFADGKLVDLTLEALERVKERCYQRDVELPDWLVS